MAHMSKSMKGKPETHNRKQKRSSNTIANLNIGLMGEERLDREEDKTPFVYDTDQLETKIKTEIAIDENFPAIDELTALVSSYDTVFTGKLGRTNVLQHEIRPMPDAKPFQDKPFRMTKEKEEALGHMLKEYLEAQFIRPSRANWISRAFLVGKPGATSLKDWRMVVDYRKANERTYRYFYPSPDADKIFNTISGSRYFSKMDLTKSFHQIPLTPDSCKYTAFTAPQGQFEFIVMPMGSADGSAQQQALMQEVFKDLLGNGVHVFIDDILIFTGKAYEDSSEYEDALIHVSKIEETLKCLKSANLTTMNKKCSFGKMELKFLGHIINREGMKPDPEKIETVMDFPTPKSVTQLRSIIGVLAFLGRYIKDFSEHIAVLTPLISKKGRFIFGPEHQAALDTLKQSVHKDILLQHADPNK